MGQGHEPRSVRPRLSQRPGRPPRPTWTSTVGSVDTGGCLLQQRTEHCRGASRVSVDGRAPGDAHGLDVDAAVWLEPRMYQLLRQQHPSRTVRLKSRFRTAAPRLSSSRSAEFISSFDHARDRATRQPSALLPLSRGSDCVPRLALDLVALALERLPGVREPDGSGRPCGPR